MRSVTTRKFFCWGCYSRHNSGAGCNFGCWNRRHSFLHTVLLSAAQFGSGFWGWVLLSSAQFAKNAVVIYSTVCRGKRQDFCKIYCYPAHNSEKFTGFLGLLSAAHFCCRAKIKVVMYGTFPKILPAFPLLLFAAHFPGGVVIQRTIYSMYNFIFAATGVVIHGTFCKKSLFSVPFPLLFTAQFPQKFLFGLLFSAQFRKNSAFAGQIVSLDTISRIFAGCCYSQHNLIF